MLVRFSTVECRRLSAKQSGSDTAGDDIVADVRGVLVMMSERCRRVFCRRFTMHEGGWTERRFPNGSDVDKCGNAGTDWHRVLRRQFHEKIVRMLRVDV